MMDFLARFDLKIRAHCSKGIIVHGGTPHLDDFMAACTAIAHGALVVYRGSAEPEGVLMVDCGRGLDPAKLVFDHHQTGAPAACGFRLWMEEVGVWPRLVEATPWLAFMDVQDCGGPFAAFAEFLGSSEAAGKAMTAGIGLSPSQALDLEEFGKFSQLDENLCPATWRRMGAIGRSLFDAVVDLEAARKAIWAGEFMANGDHGITLRGFVPARPAHALLGVTEHAGNVFVTPSTRAQGEFAVAVIREAQTLVSLKGLAGKPGVSFVHNSGAFASVKAKCMTEAMETVATYCTFLPDEPLS